MTRAIHVILVLGFQIALGWAEAQQSPVLDAQRCLSLAQQFQQDHGKHPRQPPDPSSMLYFLHIPRTAGRTYHSCFLKLGHPPSKRCAKSYDVLRLDSSMSSCGLLSSHDDYSVIDLLPSAGAIITQLREPIDRVLSSYEFAMEVAARAAKKKPHKIDPSRTNTRNVWPWSLLVPMLEKEIWRRLPSAAQAAEEGKYPTPLDPYNNTLTLSLEAFLSKGEVRDVLDNGAALQVLGLTSYSRWPEAHQLRGCLAGSVEARELLLKLALERLDSFFHVGIFDRLEDSIVSLAAVLGISFDGPSWSAKSTDLKNISVDGTREAESQLQSLGEQHRVLESKLASAKRIHAEKRIEGGLPLILERAEDAERKALQALVENEQQAAQIRAVLHPQDSVEWQASWDPASQNWYPLWRAYHHCVDNSRKKNARRRQSSFKELDIPGQPSFHFSKESRQKLMEEQPALVQIIRERNTMDAALYERARQLLDDRLAKHRQQRRLESLRSMEDARVPEIVRRDAAMEKRTPRSHTTRKPAPRDKRPHPGFKKEHEEL